MNEEDKEKLKSNSDKLSNFLFDRIAEYIKTNETSNQEMITSLMLMMMTFIESLSVDKKTKMDIIEYHFNAMRNAFENAQDMKKQ